MGDVPRLINTPLHQHPLELTNGMTIYPEHGGSWGCDNCNETKTVSEQPYHCQPCQFDMCIRCALPVSHPRHPGHSLYLTPMTKVYPQYGGEWKCDGCEVTKEPGLAYHCFQDQFDLCRKCFYGHKLPIHKHHLIPVDAAKLYDDIPGWWACDCCKKLGSDLGSRNSWHCSQCEFDCCVQCLKEVSIPLHPHPLHLTDPIIPYEQYGGGWTCDVCNREFNPQNPEPHRGRPYHCFQCNYDVCHGCLPEYNGDGNDDIPGEFPSNPSSHQPKRTNPRVPHVPPVEIMDKDEEANNLDDSEKCVICVSKPKSATIVHGNTGHVCCCMSCAYTLWGREGTCPICRAKIENVIRHFNS